VLGVFGVFCRLLIPICDIDFIYIFLINT
jgi:hypothetical protein